MPLAPSADALRQAGQHGRADEGSPSRQKASLFAHGLILSSFLELVTRINIMPSDNENKLLHFHLLARCLVRKTGWPLQMRRSEIMTAAVPDNFRAALLDILHPAGFCQPVHKASASPSGSHRYSQLWLTWQVILPVATPHVAFQ